MANSLHGGWRLLYRKISFSLVQNMALLSFDLQIPDFGM